MKVLVACEFSGVVRRAFRSLGHDAYSCDLLESDDSSSFHICGDVVSVLGDGWDLMVAHPPCTHLAVSGAWWFNRIARESPPFRAGRDSAAAQRQCFTAA